MKRLTICMIMALTAAALGSGLTGCQGDEPAAPPPAPTGNFNFPMGIATDGTYLYIADTKNSTIRQVVIATGAITTLAGTAGQVGSLDETGAAARFNSPRYLTIDTGILYVAGGWDYKVRKVVISSKVVSTFAGKGTAGSADSTDTPPTGPTALFQEPMGITQIGTDLYVIDRGAKVLRRVAIAANGATDSPVLDHPELFNKPYGIATDGTNLYVANMGSGTILMIGPSSNTVTTLAGTAGAFGSDDGTGAAARFMSPTGIACDGTNLYITDTGNSTIRKIVISSGTVTTLAGSAGITGFDDGTGAAARFKYPFGIATDGTNLYVTDTHNHTIRQIVISSGAVTTIAGIAGEPGSLDSP